MEKNDKEFRRKYDDADRNLYGGVDIWEGMVFMCLSSVVSSADIYIYGTIHQFVFKYWMASDG